MPTAVPKALLGPQNRWYRWYRWVGCGGIGGIGEGKAKNRWKIEGQAMQSGWNLDGISPEKARPSNLTPGQIIDAQQVNLCGKP